MRDHRPDGGGADGLPPDLASLSSVRPGSVEEIRDALDGAAAEGRQVLVVGTGVDLRPRAAEANPTLLRTRGLAGIEAYEPADLTLTAAAGTTLAELDAALAEHGQWLPVDPPGADRRTLGGLVATGAAGPLSTFYGAPRDHVLGLTLVTGDGTELSLGGRVMKNVAGFDLVRLVVGSRGSLGVVTSATVRVFPRPAIDRRYVLDGPVGEVVALGPAVASASRLPASAVIVSEGTDRARLVLRIHGAEAAVGADAKAFEGHLGRRFDGAEEPDRRGADDTGGAVTDVGDGGRLAVRASALPTALPVLWDLLREALPDATMAADPLAGRVRASTDAPVDAEALRALRTRLVELGGSLVLRRAPADLAAAVGVDGAGVAQGLMRGLVERFDARRVLMGGHGFSSARADGPPEGDRDGSSRGPTG